MRLAVRTTVAVLVLTFGFVLPAVLIVTGHQATCGGGDAAPAPAGPLTTGQIVVYLEGQGLTANAAAGIVGNLQQENGFSGADNSGGLGIAQWTNDGGRRPAAIAWLTAHFGAAGVQSASDQLQYLVWVHALSRSGGRIAFYGRLWGPGGTIVTLMDRTSTGEWATFAVHRASPAGLFVIRYRAPAALRGRSLRFLCRATTWPVAGWRSGVSRPGWAEVW